MKRMEMGRIGKFTLVAVAAFVFMVASDASAQNRFMPGRSAYPEVPVYNDCSLNDVGMTGIDAWGRPYIIWNPCAAQQIGPLVSAFFFQHELGHANLRTSSEDEADRYAVEALRYTNPDAIVATIRFHEARGMSGGNWRYRIGADRARFIASVFYGR